MTMHRVTSNSYEQLKKKSLQTVPVPCILWCISWERLGKTHRCQTICLCWPDTLSTVQYKRTSSFRLFL